MKTRVTSIALSPSARHDLKVVAAEIDMPQGETIAALITIRRRLASCLKLHEDDTCITIAEINAILNTK